MKLLEITLVTLLAISTSISADITSIDADGNRHTYSASDLAGTYGGTFDAQALDEFQIYADQTGGEMSFCPEFEDLPVVLDLTLENILADNNKMFDIALVLDVTGSMGDEINEVKKNLSRLIEKIQGQSSSLDIKVSLVVYRDLNQTDAFVSKIINDFTKNLNELDTSVSLIDVAGGGDSREAVLDALEKASANLSWRLRSTKSIIVIGDAPGHTRSKISGLSVEEVMLSLNKDSIRVFPMLVANLPNGFVPSTGTGDFGGFGSFGLKD